MRAGASCFRRAAPSAFCWCLVCSRIESAQNSYYFHLAIDPIYGEEAARFPWGNRGRCRFPAKEMGVLFPASFAGGRSLLIETENPPCHTGF